MTLEDGTTIAEGDLKTGLVIETLPAGETATIALGVELGNDLSDGLQIINAVSIAGDDILAFEDYESITSELSVENIVDDGVVLCSF